MAIVHRLYVIRSISGGILGHKDIGHDSAASVYLAASLGDEFLAFVKFYAVLRIKFTVRIPVHDVHLHTCRPYPRLYSFWMERPEGVK